MGLVISTSFAESGSFVLGRCSVGSGSLEALRCSGIGTGQAGQNRI